MREDAYRDWYVQEYGHAPPTPSQSIPSDLLPQTIYEQAQEERPISAQFRKLHRLPPDMEGGPSSKALTRFLRKFTNTPFEREIWDRYREYARLDERWLPEIDQAAERAGLDRREYIASRALDELKRFVCAKGIPEPREDDDEIPSTLEEICDVLTNNQRKEVATGIQATTEELGPVERALAILVKHPDWSIARITNAVGVHRNTIYKPTWETFRKAKEALDAGKSEFPGADEV